MLDQQLSQFLGQEGSDKIRGLRQDQHLFAWEMTIMSWECCGSTTADRMTAVARLFSFWKECCEFRGAGIQQIVGRMPFYFFDNANCFPRTRFSTEIDYFIVAMGQFSNPREPP